MMLERAVDVGCRRDLPALSLYPLLEAHPIRAIQIARFQRGRAGRRGLRTVADHAVGVIPGMMLLDVLADQVAVRIEVIAVDRLTYAGFEAGQAVVGRNIWRTEWQIT